MDPRIESLIARDPETFSESEWIVIRSQGITNGYGPKNGTVLKWLIARLAPSFKEASARIHDWNYWVGGTEEDRRTADDGFCRRLVNDGLQSYSWSVYYLCLTVIFYTSVRLFGGKYFKYKKQMTENIANLFKEISSVMLAVTVSSVGGMANYLYKIKNGEPFKLGMFVINIVLAGWLGYVATGFIPEDSKLFGPTLSIIGFCTFPFLKLMEQKIPEIWFRITQPK